MGEMLWTWFLGMSIVWGALTQERVLGNQVPLWMYAQAVVAWPFLLGSLLIEILDRLRHTESHICGAGLADGKGDEA